MPLPRAPPATTTHRTPATQTNPTLSRTRTRTLAPIPGANQVPLSLPPHTYETRASWVELPAGCADALAEAGLGGRLEAGLHAAAHALHAVLPLHLSCEAADVGCECNALRKATQLGRGAPQRLLLFDRCACPCTCTCTCTCTHAHARMHLT